ncbi:MAG TPA: hypothetical protein VKX17_16865 [Planctomycetota bacterium]|nr:hypothetical protein [Planctomycetota bacterium]
MAPAYDEDGQRCGVEAVAYPADLGEDHIDSKDKKLVEIAQEELNQDRRCAIYPQFTGVHEVRQKLLKLMAESNVRALILPDTVRPEAREDWINRHLDEIDVLICHPKRVMTGLDLVGFPSLIWYQTGYSTHVLRQPHESELFSAVGRSRCANGFFLPHARIGTARSNLVLTACPLHSQFAFGPNRQWSFSNKSSSAH